MADSKAKRSETARQKKRKTKQKMAEETAAQSSKRQRVAFSEQASEPQAVEGEADTEKIVQLLPNHEFEGGSTWKNLELILLIENKGIDVHRSVSFFFTYYVHIMIMS